MAKSNGKAKGALYIDRKIKHGRKSSLGEYSSSLIPSGIDTTDDLIAWLEKDFSEWLNTIAALAIEEKTTAVAMIALDLDGVLKAAVQCLRTGVMPHIEDAAGHEWRQLMTASRELLESGHEDEPWVHEAARALLVAADRGRLQADGAAAND